MNFNHNLINMEGEKKLAIFGYHKIGDPPVGGWPTWSYVPLNEFSDQLQFLKDNQWNVVDLQAFIAGLIKPEILAVKTALITFDDGYRSNLKIALPILKKFNYPAVIFIPTDFVGSYNAFDADIFYEPVEPICTWDELRELEMNGISVQSHGLSHRKLSELSMKEQEHEITSSKKIIEANLDKQVELFSFAYGDQGSDLVNTEKMLINAGYRGACLYGGNAFEMAGANPFALERIAMGPGTDMSIVL